MGKTELLGLPLINNSMTANVVRDLNALAEDIDKKVMPKKGGDLDASLINLSNDDVNFQLRSESNESRIGTTTNHDFSIISNNEIRGRVTSSGSLVWNDRIYTSRAGIQVGQDSRNSANFHLVSDDITSKSTFRIYNGNYGSGTRMFGIDTLGNVMIGSQSEVFNTEGWAKVLDVYRAGNLNITLRTDNGGGVLAFHDSGFYGSSPGLLMGTITGHELSLFTNKQRRMVIGASGGVTITSGGLNISNGSGDNVLSLSTPSIPETNFRTKTIINSINDGYNGNSLIFRGHRASDNTYIDFKLNWNKPSGDIMTEGYIVKSTSAPSGGFDGQIWIQYS